jgi:hypothetical protein
MWGDRYRVGVAPALEVQTAHMPKGQENLERAVDGNQPERGIAAPGSDEDLMGCQRRVHAGDHPQNGLTRRR